MTKKRKRETGSSLAWHTRKNSDSQYTYQILHCQKQPGLTKFLHSFSPVFDIAVITRWDLVGEFVGFWEETINLGSPKCSPLETKGFTPTAMFKFATNISRMIRIASNTGVPVKGPYITAVKSLYAGECSRKSHASCGMIAHKQKGSDQFMRIFNNNTEYSRFENFDLTRMFNKQCFCDWNIPNSHGWLHLNHFPRFIVSNRIQKLNASICSS